MLYHLINWEAIIGSYMMRLFSSFNKKDSFFIPLILGIPIFNLSNMLGILDELRQNVIYTIFICGIFAFLIWQRRFRLKKAPLKRAYIISGLLFLCGYLILILGKYFSLLLIERLSLGILLFGFFCWFFGKAYMRILILPLGYVCLIYVVFQFQFFEKFSENLNLNLQILTAFFTTFLFNLFGIPVYQEWEFLILPHITLIIDQTCSGINHVIALLLLSIPLVESGRKSKRQKILLFFIAFWLAILLNSFRVTLIGMWSYLLGETDLHGPQNIFYMPFIIVTGSMLLIFISTKMDQKLENRDLQD